MNELKPKILDIIIIMTVLKNNRGIWSFSDLRGPDLESAGACVLITSSKIQLPLLAEKSRKSS